VNMILETEGGSSSVAAVVPSFPCYLVETSVRK
jgi:hypothetical protein